MYRHINTELHLYVKGGENIRMCWVKAVASVCWPVSVESLCW